MIQKYGFAYAGENFHPHLSLGTAVLANEDELNKIKADLIKLVEPIEEEEIEIEHFDLIAFVDSEHQTDQKLLWSKKITLS
jgi:2'-5' RNA ligase